MPGLYDLTIEANGFKNVHLGGVVIEVNEQARLDFTLAIGSKTDITTVLGSASLLTTSEASLSTLIANGLVDKMSLNGWTFTSLVGLAPGVVLKVS